MDLSDIARGEPKVRTCFFCMEYEKCHIFSLTVEPFRDIKSEIMSGVDVKIIYKNLKKLLVKR